MNTAEIEETVLAVLRRHGIGAFNGSRVACCPGAGTMAHVRGCAKHPEAERIVQERLVHVTTTGGAGSDQHESDQQHPAQAPRLPGLQASQRHEGDRQPRHGDDAVPVVRLGEHDSPDNRRLNKAVRCASGRSVGPDPDAHRCGNYTRNPSGHCYLHVRTSPATTGEEGSDA